MYKVQNNRERLAIRTYDWRKQIHNLKTMMKEEDTASTYI